MNLPLPTPWPPAYRPGDATPRPDAIAIAASTPRLAPYRHVHQGLRASMSRTLQRAGVLDARVREDRAVLVDDVEQLLAACADHLAQENRILHAALRQRAPRAVLPFQEDHLEQLEAIAALRLLLQRLRDAPAARAPSLAYELGLRLSVFVADKLAHMAEEESALTLSLWAHFGDDELAALVATLSPHEPAWTPPGPISP